LVHVVAIFNLVPDYGFISFTHMTPSPFPNLDKNKSA